MFFVCYFPNYFSLKFHPYLHGTWRSNYLKNLLFNSNSAFEETEYVCVSVSVLMWVCVGVSEYDGRIDKSRK